jgi:cell division protein FtsI/penicillin-binding protein 2
LDPELQKASEKLLKSYKPDYGAIVMLDAETGRILALTSFQKNNPSGENLALKGTFPAASVFKIITATAALDKYNVTPDTQVTFNGGNHTLYKKNVMSTKVNRWTRNMTLREAFARSINTVFGRLTLERLAPQDIEDYAVRFGFNKNIKTDLPFDPGHTEIPKEKSFHLTEMASGFNKITRMSPLQGAMIAASVVEDGVMRVPYIVEKVHGPQGEELFKSEPITAANTMSPQGADKLKELMEATVRQGTSRKSFRTLVKDKQLRELIVGGKTGSLTGDNPKGKVDWFVGYATDEKQKIAVAALTVNVNYWVVKSAYLAQSLFRTHFKEQFSRDNEKFFNASNEDREPASHQ